MRPCMRSRCVLAAARLRARAGTARCASAPTSGSAASRSTWRASWVISIPKSVQLVEYPSASEVLRAFRNQAIDGMVISLDELFGLAVDGLQPRIILVVDVSHGADVVVGRPGMRTMQRPQGQVGRGGERRARRVRAEPRAGAQRHAGERRQRRAPGVERAAERVREGSGRRRRDLRSLSRPVAAAGATTLFDSTQIPGRDRRPGGGARERARAAAQGDAGAAGAAGSARSTTCKREPAGRRAAHGHSPADHAASSSCRRCRACTFRRARRT